MISTYSPIYVVKSPASERLWKRDILDKDRGSRPGSGVVSRESSLGSNRDEEGKKAEKLALARDAKMRQGMEQFIRFTCSFAGADQHNP